MEKSLDSLLISYFDISFITDCFFPASPFGPQNFDLFILLHFWQLFLHFPCFPPLLWSFYSCFVCLVFAFFSGIDAYLECCLIFAGDKLKRRWTNVGFCFNFELWIAYFQVLLPIDIDTLIVGLGLIQARSINMSTICAYWSSYSPSTCGKFSFIELHLRNAAFLI